MSILQMSFAGGVMIGIIIIARALLIRRLPKKTFLILWELVLIRLLIPLRIPSPFSVYSGLNTAAGTKELFPADDVWRIPTLPAAAGTEMIMDNRQGQGLSVLAVVWFLGMVFFMGYFALMYVRKLREFEMSLPLENEFLDCWYSSHKCLRGIRVRQSDKIAAPISYGILRPTVLMPKNMDWSNRKAVSCVLEHEYVHIRRFDLAVKLIALLAVCVHWFNPLVWIMYMIFNRDIEISCDEEVLRRFGDGSERTYAMTLIGMEELKCRLTPFYNGFNKNATEERIRLIMKRRKFSMIAVIGAILLILAIAMVFATSARENRSIEEKMPAVNPSTAGLEENTPPDPGNPFTTAADHTGIDGADEKLTVDRESKTVLSFMVEGEKVEKPATRYQGQGYSICLTDDEWQEQGDDTWSQKDNEQVLLSVVHFDQKSLYDVESEMVAEGYGYEPGSAEMCKREDDIIEKVRIGVSGEDIWDVWAVYYCYPAEAEEGWGSRLPVIVDTFALTDFPEVAGQEEISPEATQVKKVADAFGYAFFERDVEGLKTWLCDSYEGDLDVYEESVTAIGRTVKGLKQIEETKVGGECEVSIEFKGEEDSLTYLSLLLVKQADGWKVKSYGLEK